MQLGFYFDQTRCIGCYACVVACKDWHDIPEGPAGWIKVATLEKGEFPDVSLCYLFSTCFHCVHPPCIEACPVNAIKKRENDGIVFIDRTVCIGGEKCGFACQKACPYNAPKFEIEQNPKMQKCDLCIDRWAEDKKPICVEACPMRALDAGPIDELKAKYGDIREAEGFIHHKGIMPSIVIKPNVKMNGAIKSSNGEVNKAL